MPTGASSLEEWPPSLKAYVERALDHCAATGQDTDRTLQQLQSIITHALTTKTLHTTDWDAKPLPAPPKAEKKKKTPPPAKKEKLSASFSADLDMSRREERAKRFQNSLGSSSYSSFAEDSPSASATFLDAKDWDALTIAGTSEALEKRYLRLTSAPDPTTVRPLPVLQRALPHTLAKFIASVTESSYREPLSSDAYHWINDQLKAMRQDAVVQRLRGPFTVLLYETHARIAIWRQDWGELNQCLGQLLPLYSDLLSSGALHYLSHAYDPTKTADPLVYDHAHRLPFMAFRLLYDMLTCQNSVAATLTSLSVSERSHVLVARALSARRALACADLPLVFLKLWTPPHHLPFPKKPRPANASLSALLDYLPNDETCFHMLLAAVLQDRERLRMLKTLVVAQRPTLTLALFARLARFDTEPDALQWAQKHELPVAASSSSSVDGKALTSYHFALKDILPVVTPLLASLLTKIDIKGQV